MDLAALQAKVNNYTTVVGSWVKNVGNLYFSSTPQNVSVKLLDENGNVTTNTIPNAAQFRKTVWDDVGGALGQFDKTYYVDQENGNDNNTGTDSNNAFKTLYKACSVVPISGFGKIVIEGAYTFDQDVDIRNKNIFIQYSNTFTIKWHESPYGDAPYRFILGNTNLTFKVYSPSDGVAPTMLSENTLGGTISSVWKSFLYMDLSHNDVNVDFHFSSNVQDAKLIEFKHGLLLSSQSNVIHNSGVTSLSFQGYYSGKIVFHSGAKIADAHKSGLLVLNVSLSGISFKDADNNSINLSDYINGIVRDTNNVPRNLASNLVL